MQILLSHVHGDTDTPLIEDTIGEHFDAAARRYADREALVVRHQGVRWTYAELARRVDNLAAGLIHAGLKPGERIGIWAQNCAEWVLTQFATAKAGLILVNINPAYRTSELKYSLEKVGCSALILAPSFKSSDYIAMLQAVEAELPLLRLVIRLGAEKTPGMVNFDDLAGDADPSELWAVAEIAAGLRADEPINIQFTSGTTGSPKGATLTHRNILNNGYFAARAMRFSPHDRLCIPVPLYHCFGMVVGCLACITHGATMVFPGETFEAGTVLEAVEAERCTALHGVPTMFIALLEHPQFARFDLSSLRTGMMAGAPCPIEVMRRVIDEMGMGEVTIGYGMTETSPISFQSRLGDSLERRVSTVGRVHPHVEVKIVNEDGATTPRGVRGELLTRGYSVMRGYWGDEARTREAIDADGWMRTGDLATIDGEGYCNIVGRAKDMVIRGGENIFPAEIEQLLHRHPAVRDVAVVGVPDDRLGEELCAYVILRPDAHAEAEALRDFCRGELAHFKVPRHVIFTDAFPMTVSGKVLKYLLRDKAAAALGRRALRTA